MVDKKDEPTRTGHAVDTSATAGTSPTVKEMTPGERAELEALRAEIAAERLETRATLESIQAQLTPAHLKSRAREKVRDVTVGKAQHMAHSTGHKAKHMGSSVWNTLKENWVPTALIGVGAAWLAKSGQEDAGRSRDYYYDPYFDDEFPDDQLRDYAGPSADMHHYYAGPAEEGGGTGSRTGRVREKASRAAGHARDKAGGMISQARQKAASAGGHAGGKVRHARERASESAGRIGHEARRLSRQAGHQTRRMKDENPLMMAGALFGIGAALGFLIPETTKEDEWMGEARDGMLAQAKQRGRNTLERMEEVALETGKTAAETAREEAERKGLTSTSDTAPHTEADSGQSKGLGRDVTGGDRVTGGHPGLGSSTRPPTGPSEKKGDTRP